MDLQASKLYQCTKFGCSSPGHVEGVSRQKQIHRDLVCAFLGLSILNKSNCCPAFVVVVVVSLTINQRKINSVSFSKEKEFFFIRASHLKPNCLPRLLQVLVIVCH